MFVYCTEIHEEEEDLKAKEGSPYMAMVALSHLW